MGLLNRIFGQKQEVPPEKINEIVHVIERFVRDIMNHYGESHFQGDTAAKQILSVYSFGGISALAIQSGMNVPQTHAICLAIFNKLFGYEPADAAAKAQAVITAAPDRTSHLYPIIVRGGKGFLHWQQHKDDGASKDFAEIMGKFK